MPFKIKTLKNIKLLFLALFVINTIGFYAQGVKIDGVSVVVGSNIVLDSDIEKFKLEVKQKTEGKVTISDCEMLEQLMMQKLLSHHAVVDSIVVSDAEVYGQVERNIAYFKREYGSEEKMIDIYGFNDIDDFRDELYKVEKENLLIQREQASLVEKIDVTPEEVRLYYNGLKEDGELPEFQAEIQMAQVVINIVPTQEEKDRIINKLKEIKKEVEEGASFKLRAIINSDDPGVTQNGGRYTITKDANQVKEFKETAFSLDVNQVSEPFESIFGYHIMQLHEIKGNTRIASHILIQPKVNDARIKESKKQVEDIKKKIASGEITFNEAVKKYSEDKATKNNNGIIINPYTGETNFEITRLGPALYGRVNELKEGEMTDVFYEVGPNGEKMFKFILIKEKTDTHKADLVQDYEKIQQLALQKKQQEHLKKWSKDKIKETYIKISREQQKCNFEKNWKKEINK